jgi:hypothetical protein
MRKEKKFRRNRENSKTQVWKKLNRKEEIMKQSQK